MSFVWLVRMDCCNEDVVAVAESAKAAEAHIDCLGIQENHKHTYYAKSILVVTEADAKRSLKQLEIRDQALAKLTEEERSALGF